MTPARGLVAAAAVVMVMQTLSLLSVATAQPSGRFRTYVDGRRPQLQITVEQYTAVTLFG